MASPAHDSDRILSEARRSLAGQRAGGRRAIGRHAAAMKRQHQMEKFTRLLIIVGAIMLGATITGLVVGGIGLEGLLLTVLGIAAAVMVFGRYPKLKVPSLSELNAGDVRTMVGRTELWLEAQRPALPPPAVQVVDQIGVQLDALGVQLEGIGASQPGADDVRRLVGEHLPGMIESYRRVPPHLRKEQRGGRNADEQLVDGLRKISGEIDNITRQMASGDLDALAVQARFLDYRYGNGLDGPDGPPPLAAPAPAPASLPPPEAVPDSGVPLNLGLEPVNQPIEKGR